MAGANAYMNTYTSTSNKTASRAAAISAATTAATQNGYTQGTSQATVAVTITDLSAGVQVLVGISAPHTNNFARIIPGQAQWGVSVDATAMAGSIDTAVGAAPWTMSIEAFNPDGSPKYTDANPQDFGTGNGSDYPLDELDMSWTDFNGFGNVNTSEVRNIIDGTNVITATFDPDQYLGQHNQGTHNALYGEVDQHLAGHDVAVPIVGPPTPPATTCAGTTYVNGCFKGWALFHVISAQGGSQKNITGYFLSDFKAQPLTVGECTPAQQAAGTCGQIDPASIFGAYVIRLID
jgi:hypothetical protein